MRAVVCIKQVPDTTEIRIDPKTNTMVRTGVPSILNPCCAHAVEEALRLRDQFGGSGAVLTMVPPQATEALRRCLAYGADEAILLSDRAFAGADTLATSYAVATAIRRLGDVDIVLAGKYALDGDTGQVGPGVAQRLGFEQLTSVVKIDEIDFAARTIQVQRQVEEGREVVRTRLPALLTVCKELNEIRYPSLPNVLRSLRQEVPAWTREFIGADPDQCGLRGSPTIVSRSFTPPPRVVDTEYLDTKNGVEQACRQLLDRLERRGVAVHV